MDSECDLGHVLSPLWASVFPLMDDLGLEQAFLEDCSCSERGSPGDAVVRDPLPMQGMQGLENPMAGCRPWGHRELDTTEHSASYISFRVLKIMSKD